MSIDLEAIRARAEAATRGPWTYVDNGFDGYIMSASEYLIVGGEPAEGRIEPDDPNADFIAHAREDIPALLAEVERLTAELQLENTQPKPDGKCREDDGCPTENAVLRREWRKLTEQLASVTAERDAAIDELRGKCQYCARQPMRRLSDGQLDALCVTCQEYNKCNWKYRGAGKEQKHG